MATPIASSPEKPWFYGAASLVATIAIVASILSAVGGIVVGIKASKYYTGGILGTSIDAQTHYHAGILGLWITVGIVQAVLWLGIAVGLNLLAQIADGVSSHDAICPFCRERIHSDATVCPHCQREFAPRGL